LRTELFTTDGTCRSEQRFEIQLITNISSVSPRLGNAVNDRKSLRYIGSRLILSKLYQYSKSILINRTHLHHLLTPLSLIILIYAECTFLMREASKSRSQQNLGMLKAFYPMGLSGGLVGCLVL
jgi:hypothetical protein